MYYVFKISAQLGWKYKSYGHFSKFIRLFLDFTQTIFEKSCWDTWWKFALLFRLFRTFFRYWILMKVGSVASTLLQTISLPDPHHSMLGGSITVLTTWPFTTLYGGNGGPFQIMAAKVSQQFFQRLSESFDEKLMDFYVYTHNFLVNTGNFMKFCMIVA